MSISNIAVTSNARARVTVTIEIPITSNWGGTCEVNQVHGQAIDDAMGKLREIISSGGRIIGEPVVTMILVDAKA